MSKRNLNQTDAKEQERKIKVITLPENINQKRDIEIFINQVNQQKKKD